MTVVVLFSLLLDTSAFRAGTKVEPKVENGAGHIVAPETKESRFGRTSLERNGKHGGNDKGSVAGNGGRPTQDGTGLFGREQNTNGTEGGSIHEPRREEEVQEQKDKPRVVVFRIFKVLGLADEDSLAKSGNCAPDNGDHGHVGSTVLVCHDTANGSNERSDTGT